MMRKTSSLPLSYFEAKYSEDIDPWRFRTSDYEKNKYRATIGALTKPRYRRGVEVGCSIGVLTAMLAARCDQLIALDASEAAITEARRLKLSNVVFQVASLSNDFPKGSFDLVVLSEVLYYLSVSDLERLAKCCLQALEPSGEIILCHWLGETDYPLTGNEANAHFTAAVAVRLPVRTIVHEDVYRLERLSR
jgi:SAM-dependent methyltransferase